MKTMTIIQAGQQSLQTSSNSTQPFPPPPRTGPRWPVWFSLLLAICAVFMSAGSALAVSQGFLPSAFGMAAIATNEVTDQMNLVISLPFHNEDALTNLLEQLYDPTSINYQQFLTPDQFDAAYGPTASDYQAVLDFVETNGLTVTVTNTNRMLLQVSGTVAQVENAFGVTILTYQASTNSGTFYAPNIEPYVPTNVPILDIEGMNSYDLPQPNYADQSELGTNAATSNAFDGTASDGSYIGKDFRNAYAPGVTLTGSGQAVALVEFDGYYASDITAYETAAGISGAPSLQNVLLPGATGIPGINEMEVALDIEMAVSMAPGLSKVIVYEAPNVGGEINVVLDKIAENHSASQISCSWNGTGPAASTEQIFKKMAALGQSFFNASGDYLAFDPTAYNPPYDYVYPSDSPNVTSVGGTSLTATKSGGVITWGSETVWNWLLEYPAANKEYGSCGGSSINFPIPSWQQGVSMANNQGSTTVRNFPDVALTADQVHVIHGNGQSTWVGGTSAAAPLWAGFMALVNQQNVANQHPAVGFANPAIYTICAGSGNHACFHDVTTGNNEWPYSPSKYSAVSGYDLCTGWGTPTGANLVFALADYPLANVGIGNARIALAWVASAGAVSYKVVRSTTSGGPYTSVYSGTGTSFTDIKVTNGTTYYYVVTAVNSAGALANSRQVSAQPISPD